MHLLYAEIENFRKIEFLKWEVSKGLNVLVGENDSGKTTIIDAIHLALGSIAQEYNLRLLAEDFRDNARELRITCKFELSIDEKARFAEYLTYKK